MITENNCNAPLHKGNGEGEVMPEQRDTRHRSSNPTFSIRTGQLDYNSPEIVYRPRRRPEQEQLSQQGDTGIPAADPGYAPAATPASAPVSSVYASLQAAIMAKPSTPSAPAGRSAVLSGRPLSSSAAVPKVTVMMSGNDWIEYARSLK